MTLSGTRAEPLENLMEELGDRAYVVQCDLSDSSRVRELANTASAHMNGIDILVNNAGLTMDSLFVRMSDEQWQKVIEVNLSSTFKLSREVLRGMMKARWGRIINISSVVGVTGNPGQANYCASKAGIIGMSKSLSYEVASLSLIHI